MKQSFFLFLVLIFTIIASATINIVYAQNATNTTSTTNQTIAGGPNVTVLFSQNSTGFDPTTGLGTLMMVGQVINLGNETSENTNVTTELLDFNGTLGGFNQVQTVPATIPPNTTANFQTMFTDQDVIGGTGNVLFYQNTPDNSGDTGKFLGFVPPPFFLPGAGAALMGAGVPLGAGGGFAPAAGGGIGFTGGGGGGSGGGGTTINQKFFNCIQNQANTVNDVTGEVGQVNIAVCGEGNVIQQPTTPAPTTPTTPPATTEGPDESCLFDTTQPKCASVNGECPDGFNLNEKGNCFPEHERCPDGYHSEEDNETGECYPDSEPCPPGQEMDPDFPTCSKIPEPLAALQQADNQTEPEQEEDPCLSDDPPDDCPNEIINNEPQGVQQSNEAQVNENEQQAIESNDDNPDENNNNDNENNNE